jgi:hypothetical protein
MTLRLGLAGFVGLMLAYVSAVIADDNAQRQTAWKKIEVAFHPPAEYENDYGDYHSPLVFNDGRKVSSPAEWQRRRNEIIQTWHKLMGPWPRVIEKQELELLEKTDRDKYVQQKVRFSITPKHKTEGFLLLPHSPEDKVKRKPAVLVVFYEPETAIGEGAGKQHRDFARQLANRGFACLSVGHSASVYYPDKEQANLQPLSALAYVAANCYHVLANRPDVDPNRIGVVGHSYGGKWAMFASCLYDKFACAAYSDPGIVFDEMRPNVNYWEPWYLGYERSTTRNPGVINQEQPRTGAYKQMVADGRDLHELHALMAPRPFLVSGGSEDPPSRWQALNHSVAVNKLLGYDNRVAMTNRPAHDPNDESNEVLCSFFEYFLLHGGLDQK